MNNPIDCRIFQDQLERLIQDDLPHEGRELLRRHAAECPECAAILEMKTRLSEKTLGDLEDEVPEFLAEGMWGRVQGAIEPGGIQRPERPRSRFGWGWLIPAQAAAVVLLAVAVGVLAGRLNKIQQREALLAQRISRQEQVMRTRDPQGAAEQESLPAGWSPGPQWERVLADSGGLTLRDVTVFLGSVPRGRLILPPAPAQEIIRRLSYRPPAAVAQALGRINISDGLDAGEALDLLHSYGFDPERRIPQSLIRDVEHTLILTRS
jgi:hypothetical protein